MEASDELLTIAELAIGLAGFSGVVVAFTRRGELTPTDRYRFVGLFSQALTVAFLSFVPFGFHHAGEVGTTVWRASSGVALLFWGLNAWLMGRQLMPEFTSEEALPRSVEVTVWVFGIINLLLLLTNLAGWPMAPAALPYLAVLLLWFAVAAFFFATLILYRSSE